LSPQVRARVKAALFAMKRMPTGTTRTRRFPSCYRRSRGRDRSLTADLGLVLAQAADPVLAVRVRRGLSAAEARAHADVDPVAVAVAATDVLPAPAW